MSSIHTTDCTLAYKLMSRIPDGLKPILDIYEDYVAKLGTDIVTQLGSSIMKVCCHYLATSTIYLEPCIRIQNPMSINSCRYTQNITKSIPTCFHPTHSSLPLSTKPSVPLSTRPKQMHLPLVPRHLHVTVT